jgi:hypothetical protein
MKENGCDGKIIKKRKKHLSLASGEEKIKKRPGYDLTDLCLFAALEKYSVLMTRVPSFC